MAKNQGRGRQSAVPTGDYRSYKRIIEERRKNIDDDDDELYSDHAASQEDAAPDDDMDRAAAEAYAQSTVEGDDELNSALETDGHSGDEDEESMPAPRRRARSYRANQPASERRRISDDVEDGEREPDAEPEPEHEPRPHRANPRSGQAHRPARKAPRPTHKPARPAPHREPDADDEDNDFIESERVRHPAQAQRAPRRDESSHEVDDLEDYESDDTAYSDDVYEPYEFEDDLDSDEELEDSATEWADGIKRVFNRGRESLRALSAKARSGGKKRPHNKGRRRPAPKRPASAAQPGVDDAQPVQLDIQPLAQQDAQAEQEHRISVDPAEYESVSQELESIEDVRPISRRERRLSQQHAEETAPQDDYPQVNIVSRKAMRAQQDAQPEAPAQPQSDDAQPAPEQYAPVQYAQGQYAQGQYAQNQYAQGQYDPNQYAPADNTAAQAVAEPMPEPQPEPQPEQPADNGMMFGIQGHQHIMQPQPEAQPESQPESNVSIDVNWDAAPVNVDIGELGDAEQPEDEPETDEPTRKLSRRERKAARKAAHRKPARRRDYDLSDDDDDDDESTGDFAGQTEPADATARYERKSAPSAGAYLSDDDDEPEDDGYRAMNAHDTQPGPFHTQYNFGEDQYSDPFGEDEEEEEEEVEEDSRGRGGCLKAFTVLLVILLVIFGSVWALDYFNVLNVRRIAGDIAAMPLFDPLRGNLLPAATDAPGSGDVTAQPNASASPEASEQPVSATPAASATPMPGVTLVPTIQPADSQSGGLVGSALTQTSQQSNTVDTAAAPLDAAVGMIALVEQPSASGRGEWTAEQRLRAYSLASTDPSNSEFGLEYGVYVDYERADGYARAEQMTFGLGSEYTELEGVITFRGNNFRENAAYGTAELSEKRFEVMWKNRIGSIDSGYAVWSGVGWNGQPVMVHWSDEMRQMMNIRDEYKSDSELVEVIYGTLDGNIYFLDARTGEYTRDPIELGFPIKGSVSIDPRGYPLLYVGQGISKANGRTGSIGWRVYNLLNQEHMYLLNGHDELRFRTHGSFDGVCLVDAETDTAVVGGENGIFYTIKLNTQFDPTVPSISIDPVVTLYRYKSSISDELGFENSVAAYGRYAYLIDNSGLLNCFDMNTMTPVWLFDVGDDTDASIALEPQSDGLIALYTANEVDKQGSSGLSTIRKLDALSGEELWNFSVECNSDGTNGGGAFASPAVGKNQLSDLIYFNICRTSGGGTLYAFDKQSGEIIWQQSTQRYSWSSPVIVYNDAGEGVVVLGNSGGVIRMYDGRTGEELSEIEIDGNMEGSPAVYGDMLVIGTRDCNIYGIRIL